MGRSFVPCAARRRACGALAATLTVSALAAPFSAAERVDPGAMAAMEKFLARPTMAHQYRASRRLEASGVGQRAWLDVQTNFTVASGLVYEVTAEGGSGYIRARVLRSLLDEERRLTERGGVAHVAISTDNYRLQRGARQRGRSCRGGACCRCETLAPSSSTDVPDADRWRSRACRGATREESIVLSHPRRRGATISTDRRGTDARLARDDGTAQAAWIVRAPDGLSLLGHRRTARR